MIPQSSTLSIFQTSCDSFNILNCLYQTCCSLNEHNHCVVFLEPITRENSVQKEKIKNLIEKHFLDYINKKYLFLIEAAYTQDTIERFKKYPHLLKYDWFILLDSNHVYMPNYLNDIITKHIYKHKEEYDVLELQSNDNTLSAINVLSKNQIHSLIDSNKFKVQNTKAKHKIIADYYIPMRYNNNNPKFINDNLFCLAWLEEDPSSDIKSGYSFLYKKNNKVFNIQNECHGRIVKLDDNTIEIDWTINYQQVLHKYLVNENHVYVSNIDNV